MPPECAVTPEGIDQPRRQREDHRPAADAEPATGSALMVGKDLQHQAVLSACSTVRPFMP